MINIFKFFSTLSVYVWADIIILCLWKGRFTAEKSQTGKDHK